MLCNACQAIVDKAQENIEGTLKTTSGRLLQNLNGKIKNDGRIRLLGLRALLQHGEGGLRRPYKAELGCQGMAVVAVFDLA